MSYRSSGSTFVSSISSDGSYIGTVSIVLLLEDMDNYAGGVFDMSSKTIDELQRLEQGRSDRGEPVDWRKLGEREVLLTGFLRRIEKIQEGLADMRRGDFPALSIVWGNGAGESLSGCHCWRGTELLSRTCRASITKHHHHAQRH